MAAFVLFILTFDQEFHFPVMQGLNQLVIQSIAILLEILSHWQIVSVNTLVLGLA